MSLIRAFTAIPVLSRLKTRLLQGAAASVHLSSLSAHPQAQPVGKNGMFVTFMGPLEVGRCPGQGSIA